MLAARLPRAALRGPISRLTPGSISTRAYATKSAGASPATTGFISVALLLAAAGAYYYETRSATFSGHPSTFNVRIRNKDFVYTRKTDAELEALLKEHEDGAYIGRRGNPVVRWDRNWVGSNEPCEDRSAVDVIPRSTGVSDATNGGREVKRIEGDRDIAMFSIIDGHAGDATSKLLAKALHPTLTIALAGLQAGTDKPKGWAVLNPLKWWDAEKPWTPLTVIQTLQQAFVNLDDNICKTPVRLLPTVTGPSPPDAPSPTPGQTFVAMAEPAEAGACAISAVVDAENDDLYVALTGDCRAVAGWQDKDGKWRCDPLSEDQMGENPKEVERMRSEHPLTERDTVIMRGRVQGGLQPTRAFGDAVYKWTRDETTKINQVLHWENREPRNTRPAHFTPPYVTAEPVVSHRKLGGNGEQLKFIVLATDGLWDMMTSEEATLLVASYLKHPTHEDIPKSLLPQQFPLQPPPAVRPYPAEDLPGTKTRAMGSWCFEGDKNAATHLIKNALEGGDRKARGELLSMTGEMTRWKRDDITVTVVFFDDPAKGSLGPA